MNSPRAWWRALPSFRRRGYRQLAPYVAGGVVAYLFVVLGSSKPARVKWALLALPLVLVALVPVATFALKLWPNRPGLIVWTLGIALVVPLAWWSSSTPADRWAGTLGDAICWSIAAPFLLHHLRSDGSLPLPRRE